MMKLKLKLQTSSSFGHVLMVGTSPTNIFPKNPPPPFEEEEEQHAKAVLVVALVLPKVAAHVKAAAPPPTTTETIVFKALLSFLHYSTKENQK